MRSFLFMVWSGSFLLFGCGHFEDSASARSSEPLALMRVAVPGWQSDGPQSVRQIVSPLERSQSGVSTEIEILSYALTPSLVMKLAEDKVVLVVVGTPANAQGIPQSSHSSSAMLGAHWFEKRGDRWLKVAEQPGFAQEGFFGDAGELRQVDLGAGKIALAVENGSCWQGSCGKWLALYALGDKQVVKIFGDLITSDSENAGGRCGDLLKLNVGQQLRVALEDYSSALGCYRIEGRSKILRATNGPGQLVIEFSGKKTSGKIVPISAEIAVSARRNGFEDGDPTEEFLVTVAALEQRQVYNFHNGRYVLAKGKNPNPGL